MDYEDKSVIQDFRKCFLRTVIKLEIIPEQIYNMQETSLVFKNIYKALANISGTHF